MKIIIHWLVSALAILISAYVLPGVTVDGFVAALVLAVILGAINAFLRPLFVILTFPITILTFGLFVFVINGLLVMLAASIVPGFEVAGLGSGILFAIVLAIVSAVLGMFETEKSSSAV
jgi:putative membrane protein